MRLKVNVVAGVCLCAALAWFTPAEAQSATGQQRGRALGRRAAAADLSAMDRNNDGIVNRDEWTGTEEEFERRDWNHDGMLSGDELRYSAPPCEGVIDDEARPSGTSGRTYGQADEIYSSPAYQSGFDRGMADGRQAGTEDKQLRNSWDLEGQRELETADAGYQPWMGSRADYQAGYRAGFRFTYRQAFGPH
jgi:hypothetical protein